METRVEIIRPRELDYNPDLKELSLSHTINVVHNEALTSDDIVELLGNLTKYIVRIANPFSSATKTFALDEALLYVKKFRFKIKTTEVTTTPYWELLCRITVPCRPFYPSVSKMYENKTFLNRSMFNRKGLLELFGDEYRIEPVKDQYNTDSYQINAVVKIEQDEDDAWDICIQKKHIETTEIEQEDKF